jgi:negative regulator of genetic competence, sporulation and motility
MLSESDMRKYHIGSDSDCAQVSTRKAIRSLLERARDQIGFNTDGEEIFVQLYTSKHGGCELFVTKCPSDLPSAEIPEKIKKPIYSEEVAREKRSKKQASLPEFSSDKKELLGVSDKLTKKTPSVKEERNSRIAFSFPNLSDMLEVCRILNSLGVRTESRAFADEDGNFYLLLLGTGMSAYSRLDKLTFISEYGKRENPDCLVSYVTEHGKTICEEKAIETLCKF